MTTNKPSKTLFPKTYSITNDDTQMALPGLMDEIPADPARPWPDLSAYGLHFGMLKLPNGENSVAVIDEEDAWAPHIEDWGFKRTKWVGVWIRKDLKFKIKRMNILFPAAKLVNLTNAQIEEKTNALMCNRPGIRFSQLDKIPVTTRFSWKPRSLMPVAAPVETVPETPVISLMAALRQTIYLGQNASGHEVYERGDGSRFLKSNDQVIGDEESPGFSQHLFLRLNDTNLVDCAAGMVRELEAGKTLHSDDYARYLNAIFGEGAESSSEHIKLFNEAIDTAIIEVLRSKVTANASDDAKLVFDSALMFHERRPSFYRDPETAVFPLPLATAMQSIALSMAKLNNVTLASIHIDDENPSLSLKWIFDDLASEADAPAAVSGTPTIIIGGNSAGQSKEEMIAGIKTTKLDHQKLLKSLTARNPEGSSIYAISGIERVGHMDPEFKRIISYIATYYEIQGCVDIAPALLESGSATGQRLIVVGKKLAVPNITFAVPVRLPVCFEYEDVWRWADEINGNDISMDMSFGDEDIRESNKWQAPYIPASQVTEPDSMVPRNLLSATRKALTSLSESVGMSVDEYVCSKLQWSLDELEEKEYLSAEQIDAVALAIHAIDKNEGFVNSDETGKGKGRVNACIMRYARLQGLDVMFLTKDISLFRDMYRDVEDIGSMDLLKSPLIINTGVNLINEDGKLIESSPSKDALIDQLTGVKPMQSQVILATYSQFNRKPDPKISIKAHLASKQILAKLATKLYSMDDIMQIWESTYLQGIGKSLELHHSCILKAENNADAIQRLKQFLRSEVGADKEKLHKPPYINLVDQLFFREMDTKQLVTYFSNYVITDAQKLKQHWIRQHDFSRTIIVTDESHIAAGPTSQTNENIRHAALNSAAPYFSSATFAKDTVNFSVYERVFPSSVNPETIPQTLEKGGAPLQEILTSMLVEDGRMIRREHDLSNLTFKLDIDNVRQDRNEMWANKLSEVLSLMGLLSGDISEIVEKRNAEILKQEIAAAGAAASNMSQSALAKLQKSGYQYTNFSSRFYLLSRIFLMSLNADHAADLAIAALRSGQKPVITVENTLESALRDILAPNVIVDQAGMQVLDDEDEDQEPAPLNADDFLGNLREKRLDRRVSFKDVLHTYIDTLTKGFQWERVEVNGRKEMIKHRIDLKDPSMDEAIAKIKALLEAMPEIPISPLDTVKDRIKEAGYSIGELSGRSLGLTQDAKGMHVVQRIATSKAQKLDTKDAFNAGGIDALILSKMGSTGISLHSSKRFADQSQRVMIELQCASDISDRIQFWGRVNRKGQVCPPVIQMVSSGLPAEIRLLIMQMKKLARLSANISGNSDNAAAMKDVPDILNKIGNEVCYRWLENNPHHAKVLGINLSKLEQSQGFKADGSTSYSGTRFVDSLTGKMMMLTVPLQRSIYEEISREFNSMVEQLNAEGLNPLTSSILDVKAQKSESKVLQTFIQTGTSRFNAPVNVSTIEYDVRVEGIAPDVVEADIENATKRVASYAPEGKTWEDELKSKINALLPNQLLSLLPAKMLTVEEAMASGVPNAVQNCHSKAEWIKNSLKYLTPGTIFDLATEDSVSLSYDKCIIVDVTIPEDRLLFSPSAYTVKIRAENNPKIRTISLSSIYKFEMSNRVVNPVRPNSTYYANHLKQILKSMDRSYQYKASRTILDGNLFKAAEISSNMKVGKAITYTDARNNWHHAILLPAKYRPEHALDFSIVMDDAKKMAAALQEVQYIIVTNSLKEENAGLKLSGRDFGKHVRIVITDSTFSGLKSLPSLNACLLGGWRNTRTLQSADVNPLKLELFCQLLLENLPHTKKVVHQMLISGTYRDWYLKYMEKINQQIAAKSVDNILSHKSDGLDDLDSTLSSLYK